MCKSTEIGRSITYMNQRKLTVLYCFATSVIMNVIKLFLKSWTEIFQIFKKREVMIMGDLNAHINKEGKDYTINDSYTRYL